MTSLFAVSQRKKEVKLLEALSNKNGRRDICEDCIQGCARTLEVVRYADTHASAGHDNPYLTDVCRYVTHFYTLHFKGI